MLLFKAINRRFLSQSTCQWAKLDIIPKKSLVDERLSKTVVSELKPAQNVKLKLSVTNNVNLKYASSFQFQADDDGVIDLSQVVPTCQSYQDPDPMAIYWLMKPQKGSDKRFWPLKVNNGLECKYEVISETDDVIAKETIFKDYMGEGVQRIEVRDGNIVGTLFLPPGPGPHPCVIKLYGGIHKGNVIEDKSAMFASRGIASLALAFFGVPGLPKTYADKSMEMAYFEEAIDLLQKRIDIKSDKGIGICGISKGGDIALTLASILPPSKLGAIAVMNTLISSAVVGTNYKGKVISKALTLKMTEGSLKEVSPYILNLFEMFRGDTGDSYIPFFTSKTSILMIAGEDDQFYNSLEQAQNAERKTKEAGKHDFKLSSYDGLGHLIDLPWSPSTPLSNHPLFPKPYLVQMGGEDPIKHGKAQEKVWKELVDYFHDTL